MCIPLSPLPGVKRFCKDIEFMCDLKTGIYWRICWAIFTPGLMFLVLVYTLVTYKPLVYKDVAYPDYIMNIAWLLWFIGVGQLPFWALYTVYQQPGGTLKEVGTSRALYISNIVIYIFFSYRNSVKPYNPNPIGVRRHQTNTRSIYYL